MSSRGLHTPPRNRFSMFQLSPSRIFALIVLGVCIGYLAGFGFVGTSHKLYVDDGDKFHGDSFGRGSRQVTIGTPYSPTRPAEVAASPSPALEAHPDAASVDFTRLLPLLGAIHAKQPDFSPAKPARTIESSPAEPSTAYNREKEKSSVAAAIQSASEPSTASQNTPGTSVASPANATAAANNTFGPQNASGTNTNTSSTSTFSPPIVSNADATAAATGTSPDAPTTTTPASDAAVGLGAKLSVAVTTSPAADAAHAVTGGQPVAASGSSLPEAETVKVGETPSGPSNTTEGHHHLTGGQPTAASSTVSPAKNTATDTAANMATNTATGPEAAAVVLPNTSSSLASAAAPTPTDLAKTAAGAGVISSSSSGTLDGHSIHTLFTSNGSPYQNFQGRIMYGTYKIVQKMPGGELLTGFTRILHRSSEDPLMDEIPTFRAQPLHPECDTWCDFPVADRPDAVMQWVRAAILDPSIVRGRWLLLLEADYVWMRPLAAPDANNATQRGMQYHFNYIQPTHPNCVDLIRSLSGRDPETIPASGPAPVLMRLEDFEKVIPRWMNVTAVIEGDKKAVEILGWVREMYAWDIAVVAADLELDMAQNPFSPLISQPPHDRSIGNASMFHYTWGAIYSRRNAVVPAGAKSVPEIWRWEKRDYTAPEAALKVPKIPMPPPFEEGLQMQDGAVVTRDIHDTLALMLGRMNEAIEQLPDLTRPAGTTV